jgi:hypothetical protein
VTFAAWALAGLFAATTIGHVRHPHRLRSVLADLRLPRALGHAVTAVEAAIVIALLLAPRSGFLAAAAFLATASVVFMISGLLGRRHGDCGCFSLPHPVDERFFVRNALLGGGALAGWWLGSAVDSNGALVVSAVAAGLAFIASLIRTRAVGPQATEVGAT